MSYPFVVVLLDPFQNEKKKLFKLILLSCSLSKKLFNILNSSEIGLASFPIPDNLLATLYLLNSN
jgi:hypothetical protein